MIIELWQYRPVLFYTIIIELDISYYLNIPFCGSAMPIYF
jgi:hypothetical protein